MTASRLLIEWIVAVVASAAMYGIVVVFNSGADAPINDREGCRAMGCLAIATLPIIIVFVRSVLWLLS